MLPPGSQVRPALRTALLCTLLFAATVLVFWRARHYDFLEYDDQIYLTGNDYVHAGLTQDSVVWAFTAPNDYWHPLAWLSHMLDWELYGADAGGHRLTSLWWHGLNAVLLFALLRRLTGAYGLSLAGAALFAWHPLRVESVVWLSERKDLVSGCFFLLTLLSYTRYAERRRAGQPAAGGYVLTLALFTAGLMSKPTLVSLPLVLLALDFWPLGRFSPGAEAGQDWSRTWRGLLGEKVPFFLLSLAVSFVTVEMQRTVGAFTLALPLGARLGNAVVSLARYLGKFVWPVDLAVCYPHPGYWPAWAVIGAAVLAGAISLLAWRQRKARPWLLTGWLWYLAMLLPVIGLVQVGFQAMADRYTYLPLIGPILWLVCAARTRWAGRWVRNSILAATAAVLGACVARTWSQQAVWHDTSGLFAHALEVTGPNPFGEALYAKASFDRGAVAEAEQHARRSLQLDPQNTMAMFTLAIVRDLQGHALDAEPLLREVLARRPTDTEAGYHLGMLLLRLARPAEAIPVLQSAVRQRPSVALDNLQLAATLRQQGHLPEAAFCYEVAVLFDPGNAGIQCEHGTLLLQQGRTEEARAAFRAAAAKQTDDYRLHAVVGLTLLNQGLPEEAALHLNAALAVQPALPAALAALGRAETQLGHYSAASEAYEKALALAPQSPEVARASAEILARLGRFPEALERYQRAVGLNPGDASANAGLGYLLYLTGRREEARAAWETALRLEPGFPGLRERLEQTDPTRNP